MIQSRMHWSDVCIYHERLNKLILNNPLPLSLFWPPFRRNGRVCKRGCQQLTNETDSLKSGRVRSSPTSMILHGTRASQPTAHTRISFSRSPWAQVIQAFRGYILVWMLVAETLILLTREKFVLIGDCAVLDLYQLWKLLLPLKIAIWFWVVISRIGSISIVFHWSSSVYFPEEQ